jgi:hypothetical protein
MKSKVYKVDDGVFQHIVSNSDSYSDCLRKLGLTPRGGASSVLLKRRIEDLGLDTSHFNHRAMRGGGTSLPLHKILVKNSAYTSMSRLKTRVVESGLLTYECSSCGIKDWNNSMISLHLDHINGDRGDHRLENLRLLCPNCHSQTPTYAGRNSKGVLSSRRSTGGRVRQCAHCGASTANKKYCSNSCAHTARRLRKRPTADALRKLIWAKPTTEIAKEFGVSDVAVGKWCKEHGIDKPPRGFWAKKPS